MNTEKIKEAMGITYATDSNTVQVLIAVELHRIADALEAQNKKDS